MKLELCYIFSMYNICTLFFLIFFFIQFMSCFSFILCCFLAPNSWESWDIWCTLLVKPIFWKATIPTTPHCMTCNFLISVGNLSHNWKVLKFVRITVSLSLSLSLYCFRIWQFGSGRFAFQVWYLFALIFHLLFVVYSYEQRIHTAIFCVSFYSMATSTPIATRMAIFLYEENFQMSTCFLTDCFLTLHLFFVFYS